MEQAEVLQEHRANDPPLLEFGAQPQSDRPPPLRVHPLRAHAVAQAVSASHQLHRELRLRAQVPGAPLGRAGPLLLRLRVRSVQHPLCLRTNRDTFQQRWVIAI